MCYIYYMLFYQDFNEQFEGYTQPGAHNTPRTAGCFIRISMNNLKDIHNLKDWCCLERNVVLSGFQWTIWRIYTTESMGSGCECQLFYQDFNEQFEGYTQPTSRHSRPPSVVLSGFQWTIWRIYTTMLVGVNVQTGLFYQDFNEQFEGYTQPYSKYAHKTHGCFIRISMNNLKDIHNIGWKRKRVRGVVLSGFQWTIWRIYTTERGCTLCEIKLFYQDFNEQFEGYTQPYLWSQFVKRCCFIRISMNNLKDIHNRV